MAPEIFQGSPYSEKADIYSFGIMLWEFMTRKLPYDDLNPNLVMLKVATEGFRPVIPEVCNPTMKFLMEKCWSSNPKTRPTIEQVITTLTLLRSQISKTKNNL